MLLSISLWNIFNVIFAPMHIPEEESVATGSVIVFFFGLYLGRKLAPWIVNDHTEIPQKVYLGFATGLVTLFFVLWNLVEASTRVDAPSAVAIAIILVAMGLAVLSACFVASVSIITKNKLQKSEKELLTSKSEVQLLQSQLSPHFLFNTLNNLYGLSLEKSEKLPELLLKLSDLLRHSVYQKSDAFVPLKEEIRYIKNYIGFEKLRLDDRLDLTLQIDEPDDLEIAPMLLIVFVENAFKHSKNTTGDKVVMEVSLRVWEKNILFSVFNTYDKAAKQNLLNKDSGLGLENAKRRLELLYPGQYNYKVEDTGDTYKVLLQLKKS